MNGKPFPPGVHAILGDSAGGIFHRVFGSSHGRCLIDRDVLSCGPTRRCASIEEWEAMRGDFWRGVVPPIHDFPTERPLDLASIASKLLDAERITLWTATGVSEQLFIAHMIHRTEEAGGDATRIHLVRFDQVRGTGELNEARMTAHPEPLPLSSQELQDHRDAWGALTSPDPALLVNFNDAHPRANPWLRRAMQLLLRRFPEKHTGLSWWDFTLLSAVQSAGPKAARIIGEVIAETWDEGDLIGDWCLYDRLLRLGAPRLPKPLIHVEGNRANMRDCRVALTPFGLDVVECRAAYYPTNPIDDWASGVRLSSADRQLWFREDGKLVGL